MESLDYISIFCIAATALCLLLGIVSLFKETGKAKQYFGFVIGLLVILVYNALLLESDNKSEEGKEATVYQPAKKARKTVDDELLIGDAVNFEGLRVRLNSVRIEKGGEYDEKQNDTFVVFNITAENTSNQSIEVNSYASLELQDSEGYRYEVTYLLEGTKNEYYGNIKPKGKLRADVVFDVTNAESYEFLYKHGDYGEEEIATWRISASEIGIEK